MYDAWLPRKNNKGDSNLMSTSAHELSDNAAIAERDRRLRELIADCDRIPDSVKLANFTRVDERRIDGELIDRWTEHCKQSDDCAGIGARIKAMTPYVGKKLVCVVIALPGGSYTVEVDRVEDRVVHWEWQSM